MRVDGSTRYVGAARNEAIEKRKRIERVKRVQKATGKDETKPVGYYEERGMTKENNETGCSKTAQQAYREEIARRAGSAAYNKYAELQRQSIEKKEEKEAKTEEQEAEENEI